MNKPQEVTLKELVMVKDCIMYPEILDKIEVEIGKIKLGDFFMPMIHIGNLKKVQDLIIIELNDIKRELRESGIKIYELKRSNGEIKAKYLCRGYRHHVSFLPSVIRSYVLIKVCALSELDLKSGGVL
jgi:hypothetical protein